MPHGRLADPDATLGTDPRADPRMVEVFRRFGLDGRFPSSGLTPDSPEDERHAFAAMSEQAIGAIDEDGLASTRTALYPEAGRLWCCCVFLAGWGA